MWHVACTSGDMKRDSEKRRGAPNTCLLTSWVKLSQSASRSLMGMLASLPPGSDELEPTLERSSKSRASSSAARAGDVPESRLMISIVYMGLGLLLASTCENTSSQSLVSLSDEFVSISEALRVARLNSSYSSVIDHHHHNVRVKKSRCTGACKT